MASKANSPSPLWVVPACALLALAVFAPALDGPFVFDDFHLPFSNPAAERMAPAFWIGGVRPLLMATYWMNFRLSGTQPWSYHAVNVALHAVAGALAFYILLRLLALSSFAGRADLMAAAGAVLFLVHPLQTESVDYVAGRSEVLCGVFVLAGWLMFLEGMGEELCDGRMGKSLVPHVAAPVKTGAIHKPGEPPERRLQAEARPTSAAALRAGRRGRALRDVGVLVCGAAALLSKESGVCLAGLLIASDLYWGEGSFADRLRKRKVLYATMLAGFIAASILILRGLNGSSTAGLAGPVGPLSYALTQSRVVVTYFRLFFFPRGQNVDWQLPFYRSIGEAWPWLLATAAMVGLIAWLYRRARLASFGLLVFLLTLAPTSSFIPIKDALAERRMYLPVAGLAIFLVGLAAKVRWPAIWKTVPVTSVLIACAALANARSQVWSSDISLWESSLAQNPANARAHASLGGAFMLRRDCTAAAREYRRVVELEGLNAISGGNLAAAYECAGQNDLALDTYKSLVAVHPDAAAWTRIGYLEALKEHVAASLAAFENALRLDPNNSAAYSYRGTGRLALGDMAGARSDFQRALALDPGNAVAAGALSRIPPGK